MSTDDHTPTIPTRARRTEPDASPVSAEGGGVEASACDAPTQMVERNPQPTPARTGPGLAPGSRVAGRYRIVDVIGYGGMGIVYRATDEAVGVDVALKVLRPEISRDAEFLERFRNELIVARQVTHRHVVRIHDIGQDNETLFMSMDYIKGQSLQGLLKARGRLELEEAIAIVKQMAAALAEAHRCSVVHRDLKPANILLDEAGDAFISDFGIARSLATPGITRTGVVMGTPHYLSPEQARGDTVDGRSDLFTLGIIFVEMLSGKLPFAGGTLLEILSQRMAGQTRKLDELGIKVPRGIAAIIDRCLSTDVEHRYQTADELLADLEDLARPERRLRRRRIGRRLAWLVAALLVVVIGGTVVSQWRRGLKHAPPTSAGEPTKPRYAVVVLPFQHESSDPSLGWASTGVAEMLATALADSEDLFVLDSMRVFQRLQDLGLAGGSYRQDELQQLAEVFEANRLVYGSVRAVGARVQLEARLFEVDRPGEPFSVAPQLGAVDELFDLVRNLGDAVRARLEVAPTSDGTTPGTASATAMQAYTEGLELLSQGETLRAAPALEKAVAEDPAFVAAWVRLAEAYSELGRDGDALRASGQAVQAAGAGVGRMSYEARAQEAMLRGEPAVARGFLEKLLESHPNHVEAQIALADAYGLEGRFNDAVDRLQTAAAVDQSDPRVWFLLGRYSIQAGNPQQAVDEYLVRALVLQTRLQNLQGQALIHNAFGVGYERLGLLEQATSSYETAAQIRQRIGDREGHATTLHNLFFVYLRKGDLVAAERTIDAAMAIQQELGNRQGIALVHNARGALEEERGNYPAALDAYRQALQIRSELGDQWGLAESHTNVGFIYYLLGEYDNALLYQEKARSVYQQNQDQSGELLALQGIGFCQLAKGLWPQATQSFLQSLELSRETDHRNAAAVSHGNLGVVAHRQGRFVAALASFSEALRILVELEDVRGQVEFMLHEAEARMEIGDLQGTETTLDGVEALLEQGGNREQRAMLLGLQGRLLLARGELADARDHLRSALAEAAATHSAATRLAAELGVAVASLQTGDAVEARSALARICAEADRLGHAALQLTGAEALAAAELASNRPSEAEDVLRKALLLATRCGSYSRAYRLHQLLADSLHEQGETAAAEAELRAALQELTRIEGNVSPEQLDGLWRLPEVTALRAAAPDRRPDR